MSDKAALAWRTDSAVVSELRGFAQGLCDVMEKWAFPPTQLYAAEVLSVFDRAVPINVASGDWVERVGADFVLYVEMVHVDYVVELWRGDGFWCYEILSGAQIAKRNGAVVAAADDGWDDWPLGPPE